MPQEATQPNITTLSPKVMLMAVERLATSSCLIGMQPTKNSLNTTHRAFQSNTFTTTGISSSLSLFCPRFISFVIASRVSDISRNFPQHEVKIIAADLQNKSPVLPRFIHSYHFSHLK